jgi:hypothetical protein
MNRLLLISLAFGPALCQAEPYWVRYEPASGLFPDEGGWTREVSDPAPERWIEDDLLFIDSRAAYGMTDIYRMYSDGTQDPGPGETFVARWRLKVDAIGVHGDPGIVVDSDDHYGMYVLFGYDCLWTNPFTEFIYFEPGVFHTYELRTPDMRQYELFIDGTLAGEGPFRATMLPAYVSWGDLGTDSSLSEWDYVELGVIPEPGTLCGICGCLITILCARYASDSLGARTRRTR